MGLGRRYRSLRHTYGFGVHSPFAFRMVKDVVRPGRGYAWYGYEDIEAAVNSGKVSLKMEKQAKMFHRLLAFLNPSSLFLPQGIDPIFHVAASAIGKDMKIERKPKNAEGCQMIATHKDFISLVRLKDHLSTPGHSIAIMDYPQSWTESLFSALPEGLMLYSRRNAIIIHRREMMKLAYSVMI
ncbi:MAG: hypothetical protein K2G23_10215 [Muribaculaceae bacterium]|nr:hypothetical protein [Muribaculaceae bacterium]